MLSMSKSSQLTHLDHRGNAQMVDVTAKRVTLRRAVARCVVVTSAGPEVLDDSWMTTCAEIAGMQAAKATSTLIPLCHPLPLDNTEVAVARGPGPGKLEVVASTEVWARTGVEMEALCACAVAGLTVVLALSRIDPSAYIDELTLWHKSGGRSGTYRRNQVEVSE